MNNLEKRRKANSKIHKDEHGCEIAIGLSSVPPTPRKEVQLDGYNHHSDSRDDQRNSRENTGDSTDAVVVGGTH
jgi:hypothetical protein